MLHRARLGRSLTRTILVHQISRYAQCSCLFKHTMCRINNNSPIKCRFDVIHAKIVRVVVGALLQRFLGARAPTAPTRPWIHVTILKISFLMHRASIIVPTTVQHFTYLHHYNIGVWKRVILIQVGHMIHIRKPKWWAEMVGMQYLTYKVRGTHSRSFKII